MCVTYRQSHRYFVKTYTICYGQKKFLFLDLLYIYIDILAIHSCQYFSCRFQILQMMNATEFFFQIHIVECATNCLSKTNSQSHIFKRIAIWSQSLCLQHVVIWHWYCRCEIVQMQRKIRIFQA